jgi:hypothetical protein
MATHEIKEGTIRVDMDDAAGIATVTFEAAETGVVYERRAARGEILTMRRTLSGSYIFSGTTDLAFEIMVDDRAKRTASVAPEVVELLYVRPGKPHAHVVEFELRRRKTADPERSRADLLREIKELRHRNQALTWLVGTLEARLAAAQ